MEGRRSFYESPIHSQRCSFGRDRAYNGLRLAGAISKPESNEVRMFLISICLLATDKRRTEVPWLVIIGDTLFVGQTERPDLLGREREMALALHDSLHANALPLPNEAEFYPGHQVGSVCGADLSSKPSSTIGFEKRWSRGLSMGMQAFIDNLFKDVPPRSAETDKMVAAKTAV